MRLTIAELEKQLKQLKFEIKLLEVLFIGWCVIRLLKIIGVLH